uniref:GST C-terminal domain-containing protein n=1 Tax=Plectus sambesii TaxID=2011161 RepID=A0A914WFP1_9BILA
MRCLKLLLLLCSATEIISRRSGRVDKEKATVAKCNLRLDYWNSSMKPQLVAVARMVGVGSTMARSVTGYVKFLQQYHRGPVLIDGYVSVPLLRGFTCGSYVLTYGRADCNKKAGKHYNPTKSNHGSTKSCTRHVGDLDVIKFDQKYGISNFTQWDARIQLQGPTSIIGRTFVILMRQEDNAAENDLRIACGVIGYAEGYSFNQVEYHVPNANDEKLPLWLLMLIPTILIGGITYIAYSEVYSKQREKYKIDETFSAVHLRHMERLRKSIAIDCNLSDHYCARTLQNTVSVLTTESVAFLLTDMADYTLYYFNYKGYAEGTRLLLTYLGLPFHEETVDPDKEGWEKLPIGYDKVQRYIAADTEYKMRQNQTDLPLTWLCPVLQFGVKRLTEPASIGQFLAATHDETLMPVKAADQARAIQYARFWIADIHGAFQMYKSIEHQTERTQKWNAWIEAFLHPRLTQLNKELVGKEFILNSLCWADFYLYNNIKMIEQLPSVQLENYQAILSYTKRIESLAQIRQYIEDRRMVAWIRPTIAFRQPYPPRLVAPAKQDIGDYPWERRQVHEKAH